MNKEGPLQLRIDTSQNGFQFSVQTKHIKFEKIPLIKKRNLKKFSIINFSENQLEIDLQCSIPEVSFQLSNENDGLNSLYTNEVLFNFR